MNRPEKEKYLIKVKTIKRGEEFITNLTTDLKNINSEGIISELQKLIDKIWKEDVCSGGRQCEKCGVLIPNHYGNDLCITCYNKLPEVLAEKKQKVENINPVPKNNFSNDSPFIGN